MTKKNRFGCGLGFVLAGAAAVYGYVTQVRPWFMGWGANQEEVDRPLPGDGLVQNPKYRATHAVTINAPASQVWPWIVQIGQGRGGFYSYDWLENAIGLNIHSAERILEEHQVLRVGDVIPLAEGDISLPVVEIEPERALVLGGRMDANSEASEMLVDKNPSAYLENSWAFFLEPLEEEGTRLIERIQLDWNPSLVNDLMYRVFLEPVSFLMERKMLLGIKERAERLVSNNS